MNTQTIPFEVMCRTPWGKIVWKTFDAVVNFRPFGEGKVFCNIVMPQLFHSECLATEDFYEQIAWNINMELPENLSTTAKSIEIQHTKEFVG